MASQAKLVASEILMCGLKKIPFGVGTAIEIVEAVRQRHERLGLEDRIKKLEQTQTQLDQIVNRICISLTNLKHPSLNMQKFNEEVRNLQDIQQQGWEPMFFEGLLRNSSHWEELQQNPQNYGRVLTDHSTVDRHSIHVIIDADKTRILELSRFAFAQLLSGQPVGIPEAKLIASQDVWAFPTSGAARPIRGSIDMKLSPKSDNVQTHKSLP